MLTGLHRSPLPKVTERFQEVYGEGIIDKVELLVPEHFAVDMNALIATIAERITALVENQQWSNAMHLPSCKLLVTLSNGNEVIYRIESALDITANR